MVAADWTVHALLREVTVTPRELVEKWRKEAESMSAMSLCCRLNGDGRGSELSDAREEVLNDCAAELEAALNEQEGK